MATSDAARRHDTSEADDAVIEKYTDAFMRGDVATLTSLLAEAAVLEMPPVPLWYRGIDHYSAFMERVFELRGRTWRTIRTNANGQPAFAAYAPSDGGFQIHTVQILTANEGAISRNVVYQDPTVFAELSLPTTL